jgi:phage baseplate assembly protein gpV
MSDGMISNLVMVTIEGAPLPQDLAKTLGPCWVESSVNLPGAFHLTFRAAPLDLMPRFFALLRIGARVAVYGVADGQGRDTPLVSGLVTGVETEYGGGISTTVLRGLDHSFKMLRYRRAAGYRNMTAAEIVTELAERDGVAVGMVEPTTPQYDLITQPNISDWQFVRHLADLSDMEADFDNEGLLRFRKSRPALSGVAAGDAQRNPYVLQFGANMLRCRTGVTASDQVSGVTTRGWNEDEKDLLLGRAPALSSPDLDIGMSPGDVVGELGEATWTETGTPYATQAETDRAASSLAADITSAFAEMEIEVRGQPDLVPGVVIVLKDAGPPFDGKYTVSTTRHVFDQSNGYTTWVWVTGRQVRTLYGLAGGGDQPAPRIDGVVNAIVDDINDPKEQGRVRLRFPWFDDTYVSGWTRTVQFGGLGGGGVISPEPEDEVLVAFDRGALDHPYVLGGLYSNAANSPSPHDVPLQTGGRLNRRSLVSRSGQRLEILDADGLTGVRLRSGDEALTVFLDQTQTKITISSDGTVDISGTGAVSITSTERLTLDAPAVNISGIVSIKGDTSITGAVGVNGATEISGAVDINGAVEMSGLVNMTGGATVEGDMTLNTAQVMVVPEL